jgi:hypothetical protein
MGLESQDDPCARRASGVGQSRPCLEAAMVVLAFFWSDFLEFHGWNELLSTEEPRR